MLKFNPKVYKNTKKITFYKPGKPVGCKTYKNHWKGQKVQKFNKKVLKKVPKIYEKKYKNAK